MTHNGLATLLLREFQKLHSVNPSLIGEAVSAEMGVDNIQAVVVPESTLMLLGAGLLGVCSLRRWKK